MPKGNFSAQGPYFGNPPNSQGTFFLPSFLLLPSFGKLTAVDLWNSSHKVNHGVTRGLPTVETNSILVGGYRGPTLAFQGLVGHTSGVLHLECYDKDHSIYSHSPQPRLMKITRILLLPFARPCSQHPHSQTQKPCKAQTSGHRHEIQKP